MSTPVEAPDGTQVYPIAPAGYERPLGLRKSDIIDKMLAEKHD